MKKKRIITALTVLVFCLSMSLTVFAADEETGEFSDSAGNLFKAGEDVTLESDSVFSAFTMGRKVEVDNATAEGAVFVMAQDISIDSSRVGEGAYLMGETVKVRDSSVHGNIFSMGRKITISGDCNAVYAMGETISFDGNAKGLYLQGANITLAGKVDGDVVVESGSPVNLDPDLRITGNLKITGESEPEIPDTAEIGSFDFEEKTDDENDDEETESIGSVIAGKIKKTIYWIAAMSLFGILLCWLFGEHIERSGEVFLKSPASAVIKGTLGWICMPMIILFMFISFVLAPAGAMLLAVYVVLLCAGTAFTGASVGRLLFAKIHPFLSSFICIAILEVLRQIPFLGFLVGIICDMYLLAYVVDRLYMAIQSGKKPPLIEGGVATEVVDAVPGTGIIDTGAQETEIQE